MHPESFQSSGKRQADLGRTRSSRACRTHSLPDTGDWYLPSLVCRWHLTSSFLKADLYLTPGQTFCETLAGCCPWYENILESILDLYQWMLCSGIRAGSRETEPSVWRGSQGLSQHAFWEKDCYILICGSCYELLSGQKTLFMSLSSCSAKHDYFKSFHFPQKIFSLIAFCTVPVQYTVDRFLNDKPGSYVWLSFLSNTGKSVSLFSWETESWGDNKKLGVGKKSAHPNRILRSSSPVHCCLDKYWKGCIT